VTTPFPNIDSPTLGLCPPPSQHRKDHILNRNTQRSPPTISQVPCNTVHHLFLMSIPSGCRTSLDVLPRTRLCEVLARILFERALRSPLDSLDPSKRLACLLSVEERSFVRPPGNAFHVPSTTGSVIFTLYPPLSCGAGSLALSCRCCGL